MEPLSNNQPNNAKVVTIFAIDADPLLCDLWGRGPPTFAWNDVRSTIFPGSRVAHGFVFRRFVLVCHAPVIHEVNVFETYLARSIT